MSDLATVQAAEILEKLQNWWASYYHDRRLYYKYSPERDNFEKSKWEEYADLDARRIAASVAALPWQDTLKDAREAYEWLRGARFHPFGDGSRTLVPLSIALDQYQGLDTQDRRHPWKAALMNWTKFRLRANADTGKPEFQSFLSSSQLASYRILEDWWSANYCDKELIVATRSYMEKRAPVKATAYTFDSEELQKSASALVNTSLYHAWCFHLFLKEFHSQAWEPNINPIYLHTLQRARYDCARVAISQRLSYAVLHPELSTSLHNKKHYPRVIFNQEEGSTKRRLQDYPYYLWDTLGTPSPQTVVVRELLKCPEYICVSHTWGRWRDTVRPPAGIPGVPWDVPRNTRFDVEDLPEQLKKLGYRYVWFDLFCIPQERSSRANEEIARQAAIFRGARACIAWLTDVQSWRGVRSALDWSSLTFLKNTTRPCHSAVSTSNVAKLDGRTALAAEAASAPAELIKLEHGFEEPVSWFSSLWTLQEAVLCPYIQLCARDWTRLMDRWDVPISLESLMVFLLESREYWTPFGPMHKEDFVEPTVYTLALRQHPDRLSWDSIVQKSWPTGARQLNRLRNLTKLDDVLRTRGPMDVFANANVRQCTDSRAPAIMSALGVTDWYVDQMSNTTESYNTIGKDQLVFDMYPLSFLREAALKFGAIFFETISWSIGLGRPLRTALGNREPIGSLLPFTRQNGWDSQVSGSFDYVKINTSDHDAVSGWRIRPDGCVYISRAGIALSSMDDPSDVKYRVSVHYRIEDDEGRVVYTRHDGPQGRMTMEVLDFATELRRIAGEGCAYAVALHKSSNVQHGIILVGLQDGIAGTQYLVNIGGYFAPYVGLPFPETQDVDWIVL